ncbi:GNAT family N-acetyltransferase [Streptosporangium soli]|nr:GNAT family N-acetyltransferase [Streptosporangium sp. KLBMP 9127]
MFDHDVHAYLRALAGERARRTGPFLATFDEHDAGPYRNYAVPDDDADPTPGDLAELITAFTNRSRVPRLEYLPGAAPKVEPALLAAGFTVETRLPLLTCSPADVAAPPAIDSVELVLARTDRQLRQVAEAQNEAYGQPETGDHDVARLRGVLDRGGLVALAVDTGAGTGVGGGECGPPLHGVSELAGIGVRESHRRRGIAAALTSTLTRACPAAGITTPFLMPFDDDAERIYHRAGYRPVTEMLHISLR